MFHRSGTDNYVPESCHDWWGLTRTILVCTVAPMTDDVGIGAAIKELRVAVGMSQADLSTALHDEGIKGIYPQTIVKIEQGRRSLKFAEGMAIARALGLESADLLDPAGMHPNDVEVSRLRRAIHEQVIELQASFWELRKRYAKLVTYLERLDEEELSENLRWEIASTKQFHNPDRLAAQLREELDELLTEGSAGA